MTNKLALDTMSSSHWLTLVLLATHFEVTASQAPVWFGPESTSQIITHVSATNFCTAQGIALGSEGRLATFDEYCPNFEVFDGRRTLSTSEWYMQVVRLSLS